MLAALLSPWARWAAVAVLIAALGLAIRHEHDVSKGLRDDLALVRGERDAWKGAADRQSLAASDLRAQNDAVAKAAALQCGTGQTSAFERGRAFGRAEVAGGSQ